MLFNFVEYIRHIDLHNFSPGHSMASLDAKAKILSDLTN